MIEYLKFWLAEELVSLGFILGIGVIALIIGGISALFNKDD